jgi:hypothetical protein
MESKPEPLTTPSGGQDRREQFRHEVRRWARIEVGADGFACCVFDLSANGAKVRAAKLLIVQELVRLVMIPFGSFEGEVMWLRDGVVGIRFADGAHHRVAKLIASALNELPM